MPLLVYFSSHSQNTHRFVERVGLEAWRIPLSSDQDMPVLDRPYVLVVPTYAGHDGSGAVPKQVIRFLNVEQNRHWLRGVIASGNRNFGAFYGHAGKVIAAKTGVPFLYRFELMGTDEDVANVRRGVTAL